VIHASFAKETALRIEFKPHERVLKAAIPLRRFKPLKEDEIVGMASAEAVTFEGNQALAKLGLDVCSHHPLLKK
jgi:hypothetical protein